MSLVSVSSVLLIVAFVVVAWSVRTIDRNRRPYVVAQVMATDIMEDTEPAFPRDHVLLRQRNDMNSHQSLHESSGTPTESSVVYEEESRHEGVRVPRPQRSTAPAPASQNGSARLRTGRTAAAVAGLVAVVAGLITAVLAPFTAIAWPLPVFLLVIGCGLFGGLRYLALSDRGLMGPGRTTQRNIARAESSDGIENDHASVAEPAELEGLVVKRSSDVYDHQGASSRSADADPSGHEIAAMTAPAGESSVATVDHSNAESVPHVEEPGLDIESLREQARRVAAGKPVAFSPAISEWSPVEVPKPTYVDAPAAHNVTPEPITVPEAPKSTSSSLAEAAHKGTSDLNLDDVLSRRRA